MTRRGLRGLAEIGMLQDRVRLRRVGKYIFLRTVKKLVYTARADVICKRLTRFCFGVGSGVSFYAVARDDAP
jgi:hypothetical protein